MHIPGPLLDAASQHRHRGWHAALLIRHAERHPITELRRHHEVRLNDAGHAQALRAGQKLARVASRLRVHHSPVERCAETARGLVAGAQEAGCDASVVGAVATLAYPFVLDADRGWDLVESMGNRFIRHWFDGHVDATIFQPRASAARAQLNAMAHVLHDRVDDALTVFVSHDWNIALLREDVLGVRPEDGWPGFLDGIAVSLDVAGAPPEIVVELGERSARRPGPRGG